MALRNSVCDLKVCVQLSNIFFHDFTQHTHDAAEIKMRLYYYRNGSFEPYELPTRSRCSPEDIENAIRKVADKNGRISKISIRVGNEYIPIEHVDEARVVSRMLTADHDCFVGHLYAKGFPEEPKKAKIEEAQKDAYEENELWKLEFDYEQHPDLGDPCFGSSDAYKDEF
jgi:hypothetical protein